MCEWWTLPSCGWVFFSAALSLVALILAVYPINTLAAVSKKDSVAERLVAEALQAEVKGDEASRKALLDQAVRAVPDYRLARWQQGQIELANQWMNVEEAQRRTAADPRHTEYAQLRTSSTDSLADQLMLAYWCRKHQLPDEANVHWTNVLGFEPTNEEALRALGKRWYAGRLMTYAEADAAKERLKDARAAAKRFAPQMAKWERILAVGDQESREQSLDEIREISEADCHSGFGGINAQRTAERRSTDDALSADRLGVCEGAGRHAGASSDGVACPSCGVFEECRGTSSGGGRLETAAAA